MKRLFINELNKWEDNNIKNPLMVIGARQIGKTYIINEFCKNKYEKYIYLNFEHIPNLSSIFEKDLVPERIINEIELELNLKIDVNKTAIFFDEIQECEKAITSLKYFSESEINYRIICAGSLLGVKLHRFSNSFPVRKGKNIKYVSYEF